MISKSTSTHDADLKRKHVRLVLFDLKFVMMGTPKSN